MRLSFPAAGPAHKRRLNTALLFSLGLHALLLSLTFGQGLGLPGLSLPWQARRAEAPDLRVVLGPVPAVVEPAQVEPAHAQPQAVEPQATEQAGPVPDEAAADLKTLAPPEPLGDVAPPMDAGLALIAVDRLAAWAVPSASAVPTSAIAAMSAASGPVVEPLRRITNDLRIRAAEPAQPEARPLPATVVAAFAAASSPVVEPLRRDALRPTADRDARERAAELSQLDGAWQETAQKAERLEAARVEALRQEAARAEAARLQAERQEAARQLAARQEAARVEAARQDALRQDAARVEAARLEGERQEAARQGEARAEAARREAAREEAGRQDAARQAAARLEAGRIEAAKLAAAQAEAEQREARLRAIGKQLDAEAAQRDAERKRPDWAPARRGRLFGRSDANEELVLYAEAVARKIQLNPTFEMVREAARQTYVDPIVTMAVRSDGSVESVTFVRSSGVPAIDDAVRRIVQSQERYQAFQPALLRDFDVVEIRRSWHFDMAVRLY